MPAATLTTRAQWIEQGLLALAGGGPDSVRVEVLAKALGVTKGGFYGQFADRDAFLEELLDTWERRAVDDVLQRVEDTKGGPKDRIRRAGALTFSDELIPIELAVRYWARRDRAVARRLRRVDNQRMNFLRKQFAHLYTDPADIEARSTLAFALAIGHHLIAADHDGRSLSEVLDRATQLFGA